MKRFSRNQLELGAAVGAYTFDFPVRGSDSGTVADAKRARDSRPHIACARYRKPSDAGSNRSPTKPGI